MEIKSTLARIFKTGGYSAIQSELSWTTKYSIVEANDNIYISTHLSINDNIRILEIKYTNNERTITLVFIIKVT